MSARLDPAKMDELREMACRELVETITEYLEGTMDEVDRRRFEVHLAGCPHCRTYVAQMRTTIDLAGKLRPELLPARMRQDLLTAFHGWRRGRDDPPAAG